MPETHTHTKEKRRSRKEKKAKKKKSLMDSYQIDHALKSRRDLPTNIFKGVFALNQIPATLKPPFALIFNSEPLPSDGQHWLALFCPSKSGSVEFFDTSGQSPHFLIQKTESLQRLLTFAASNSNYVENNNYHNNIIWNKKQIQDGCSVVCGHFCILFVYCRLKGMPYSEFLSCFAPKINNKMLNTTAALMQNDIFVYALVHTHFDVPKRTTAATYSSGENTALVVAHPNIFDSKCLQTAKELRSFF